MILLNRIYRKIIRPFIYLEKFGYTLGVLKPSHLTLPDFLCIGVEKSGSSWLYQNLKIHPQIFMSSKKEIDYFRRNYWFYSYPLSFYSSYFSDAPANSFKGESTPYCTMSLSKIQFVKAIMPNLKLIITLRNPVDRLWSAGLMHFIGAQKRKFENITHLEFMNLLSQQDILEFGFYDEILKRWRSVFSEKQIKIMFYDDLVDDPKTFLENCFEFLGVNSEVSWDQFLLYERINKSPEYPMPEDLRAYFFNMYKPSTLQLMKEFGDKVKPWLN